MQGTDIFQRECTTNMKNKKNKELAVCGFEAVKALEKNNEELIQRLYFTAERAPLFGGLCKRMAKRKAPYNQVEDPKELEKLCGSVHHQGVVAMIPQPEITPLTNTIAYQWADRGESALLLDRVGNANNLGAIVRSAAFFGIKNIVIPLDEAQSSITTSSYRVAQGGMEKVSLYSVNSISDFLTDVEGKLITFGTDVRGKMPISEMSAICKKEKKSAVIVLGNEEQGISDDVRSACDYLVTIPSKAQNLESLNVAQAAAVILYEFSK